MNQKLTLSLDKEVIEKAKVYAKSNDTSLSKLIESYLGTLTTRIEMESDITPLVENLSGVIDLPKNFDFKEAYLDYLIEKHK